jgi:hypothetical protein
MATKSKSKAKSDPTSLDGRYGEIGISAVAAAVRYQRENGKRADAPVGFDDRWEEGLAA